MAEKLSVQIALEGGKEVEKQLADIGKSGEQAFAGISQPASEATDAINQVGDAAETTAEKTKGAFEGVTLQSVKTGAEIAKLGAEIAKIGVEIGLAVRQHQGWISQLVSLASTTTTVARSLGLLVPAMGGVAAAAGALALAVPIIGAAATAAAADTEKLNNTLQTLAGTTGKSFKSLQQGEATFKQIGISAETFRGTIAKINETLADTGSGDALSNVLSLVKQIAAGEKGIEFADWVKAEDKIKAVAVAMKQAADNGKNATQVLLEFIRNADLATAVKVGAAFGLSEADVDRVRRLSENIGDLVQRVQGVGVLISPEASASFERLRISIIDANSAWERLRQAAASTIFPQVAAEIGASFNNIKTAALNAAAGSLESLNNLAAGAATLFGQIVEGYAGMLRSIRDSDLGQAIGGTLRDSISGLNAILAEFIGGMLQGMGASAAQIQRVKDEINGVAQAAQTAGQALQKTGAMFTSWGTVAEQAGNAAKKGVDDATGSFTSFGTVAEQAGQKGAAGLTQVKTKTDEANTAAQTYNTTISGIVWSQISSAGVSAWNAITGAIQNAINKALEFLRLKPAGGGGTAPAAPGLARGGRIGGRGTGTSDSNLAWLSRGEYVMPAWAVRQPGVLQLLEALRKFGHLPEFAAGGLVGALQAKLKRAGINIPLDKLNISDSLIIEMVRTNLGEGPAFFIIEAEKRGVEDPFESFSLEELLKILELLRVGLGNWRQVWEAYSGTSMARGGLLGGRGTGTSDSNLAWVSRGEHIMPARAVQQPGVLAFLEALRRSGGNLRRVLDGMGHFALGGMVPRAMPAFAAGGLSGMSHITIQFPGLPAIGGLRASSDVVDELRKAAALAQVRSGGRKPSRYS